MPPSYPDLPAAMVGWLRAQPTVVAAFAEDTSSATTTKFWADAARQGVSLPWAVYEEVEGDLTYMTAAGGITSSLDSGKVRFLIVAEGKKTARDLGRMVTTVLNDAPLAFADGTLMLLRARKPFFVPVAKVAPHCPNAYARVIVFETMVQRNSLT